MKKIIAACLASMIMLTGCNYDLVDTNYTFNKAYINVGDEVVEIDVASWSDSSGEDITIVAKDGTIYMCSVQNCVMVKE